jgi:hypothetical protein
MHKPAPQSGARNREFPSLVEKEYPGCVARFERSAAEIYCRPYRRAQNHDWCSWAKSWRREVIL